MTWIDYAVLILYFATMIAIGLWAMRRVKGQEDYFMGGRGFGKILQNLRRLRRRHRVPRARHRREQGLDQRALRRLVRAEWLFITPVYWITAIWYRRMRHLTLGDWFVERYESKGLGAAFSIFAIFFYMYYLSTMFTAIAAVAAPLMGVDTVFGFDLKTVLVPLLALIVIVYGVLGGLTAAYWTDLIQGLFIILLSVLLIPFGLWALVKKFGDPETQGVMDGFGIMHRRILGGSLRAVRGRLVRVHPPVHRGAHSFGLGRDCGEPGTSSPPEAGLPRARTRRASAS